MPQRLFLVISLIEKMVSSRSFRKVQPSSKRGSRSKQVFFGLTCAVVGLIVFAAASAVAAPVRPHRGVYRCGTFPPNVEESLGVAARIAVSEAFASTQAALSYEVPVAFHIIQTADGRNTATEEQIASQISRLNSSFRKVFRFKTVLIDLVVNDAWFEVQVDSQQDLEMRSSLRVGDAGTLNVFLNAPYLDNRGDLLGISLFPWLYQQYSEADGVLLRYSTLPGGAESRNNRGKVLVHEVGHWLGLFHTFEPPRADRASSSTNNGCRGKGDRVGDTPAERVPHYICRATDSCPQPGLDPIHNFMNYTDDGCTRSFTAAQKNRMRAMFRAYRRPAT